MSNKYFSNETDSIPINVAVESKNNNRFQPTGAAAETTASDLNLKDRLPLIFSELDKGRSTKLKERAAQIVLIYSNAIQLGYVLQKDLNLFNSARFELREVPFRRIDKAYPPVRNPEYKRLSEESRAAHAALDQRWNHLQSEGIDPFKCNDPQLAKLRKACGNYSNLDDKLPNPALPTQFLIGERVWSQASKLFTGNISGAHLETIQNLPDHPVKKMALDAYQEIKVLQDAAEQLKELVKSSTQIKAIVERRLMPPTTVAAYKVVEDILTTMTNQVKAEYITFHHHKVTNDVEGFLKFDRTQQLKSLELDKKSKADLQARNEAAKAKFKQETGRDWGFREEKRDEHWIEGWFPLLTGKHRYEVDIEEQPLKVLKNWKALVLDYFTIRAEEIQQFFVERAGMKIAVIVEAKELMDKPTILNANANDGVIQGNIKFEFRDGSYFTVRHKIVEKALGGWRDDKVTTFCQFPTTFHDAVLANGKEMPGQPSEHEMKTVFIGAKVRKAS